MAIRNYGLLAWRKLYKDSVKLLPQFIPDRPGTLISPHYGPNYAAFPYTPPTNFTSPLTVPG